MARIDGPTLQCDRCKTSTQDEQEMSRFRSLTGMYDKYQGASEKWDLCPKCWHDFQVFIEGKWVVSPRGLELPNREAGIQHDGDSW